MKWIQLKFSLACLAHHFVALFLRPLEIGVVCLLGLACCISQAAPRGPSDAPRIVLVETFDVPVILEHTQYFLKSMEKIGYKKANIKIIKSQGDPGIANRLLQEEVEKNRPDIIVANATLASKVAYQIGKKENIPVVFMVVSDPVGAAIVKKSDGPTGDIITGLVHSVPRAVKIDMVMRILRSAHHARGPVRFGYLHTDYPSSVGDLRMLKEVAKARGDVDFASWEIPYNEKNFNIRRLIDQLLDGVNRLESKVDYWWIAQDPVAELEDVVRAIAQHSKHPIVCGTNLASIQNGALVYISADTESGAHEAALTVDLILKGRNVGSIPVHPPSKIDFGVNLITAKKMGVAIPSDLMELAESRVIK